MTTIAVCRTCGADLRDRYPDTARTPRFEGHIPCTEADAMTAAPSGVVTFLLTDVGFPLRKGQRYD